jgi:hypothetical protein
MKPVRPDSRQPARNASVRKIPDSAKLSALSPSGFNTSVDVRNTTNTSGIRMRPIVLN